MRGDSGFMNQASAEPMPMGSSGELPGVLKRCGSCKYWLNVACHREAPDIATAASVAAWPLVSRYDWCGEWDGGPR